LPTNQARGIVISLTGTPCQIQFVSSHSLQSFMRAIFGDIGRVVSSHAVIYKPGGGITMTLHEKFQGYVVALGWQYKHMKWRTEEQWSEEWDEGEEL
jgi:hypothetical protein